MQINSIIKRDGSKVSFDKKRIYLALEKAFNSEDYDNPNLVDKITNEVVSEVINRFGIDPIIHIEVIQDLVEELLMKNGYHQVAKKYILYREKRAKVRQGKIKAVEPRKIQDLKIETAGKIFVRDLTINTIIGVYEFERKRPQEILVNLELFTDLTESGKTDELEYALDYSEVVDTVKEFVANSEFFLVEKLATEIAELVIKKFLVKKVKVIIDKPNAIKSTRSVAIEVNKELIKAKELNKVSLSQ